jgi:DnaA family protein
LQGLHTRDFICLDDVHTVAGDTAWEIALLALMNRATDSGSRIIVSAGGAPRQCGIALADLESRLSQLPVFHLQRLADADRKRALQLRARYRGLELPDETAAYLLVRSKRDMRSLYSLLDKLDTESLAAQRRLTVPFVREVLTGGDGH